MHVNPRDLDSVQRQPGFKKKQKFAKSKHCKHVEDKRIPSAKTPAGHHIARCSHCGSGFVVEEEEKKRKAEERARTAGNSTDFDDAFWQVSNHRPKRDFKKKGRPFFTRYDD